LAPITAHCRTVEVMNCVGINGLLRCQVDAANQVQATPTTTPSKKPTTKKLYSLCQISVPVVRMLMERHFMFFVTSQHLTH